MQLATTTSQEPQKKSACILATIVMLAFGLMVPEVVTSQVLTEGTLIIDQQALDNRVNSVVIPPAGLSEDGKAEIQSIVSDNIALSLNTRTLIQNGGLSVAGINNITSTFTNVINVVGSAVNSGAEFDNTVTNSLLANIVPVFDTMVSSGFSFTALQFETSKALFTDMIAAFSTLAKPTTTISAQPIQTSSSTLAITGTETSLINTQQIILNLENLLSAGRKLGFTMGTELMMATQAISQAFLQSSFADIAEAVDPTLNLVYESDLATTAKLTDLPQLLEAVVEVIGIQLDPISTFNSTEVGENLQSFGLSAQDATALVGNLSLFPNPESLLVADDNNSLQSTSAVIAAGFGISSAATYAADTLNIELFDGASLTRTPLWLNSVAVVSSVIPAGQTSLPDGSLLIVDSGIAVRLLPAPADVQALSSAIYAANADITFALDGGVTISNSDFTFSGTFDFKPLQSIEPTTETPTFATPQGGVADINYVYTVTYSNGESQTIAPFLQNDSILDSIAAAGFTVSTNRSNGVITIVGAGEFKPDYFVTTPSAEDEEFRISNGNSLAAFQPVDANGDGTTDYRAITEQSVQILYTLP